MLIRGKMLIRGDVDQRRRCSPKEEMLTSQERRIRDQARIQKLMEGGAERTARKARAKFFATTPTQQYSLTEIQRFNRQECLQSPRMAPSTYTTRTCISKSRRIAPALARYK